jgi:tetratricopeptide (TPR) repeat protein
LYTFIADFVSGGCVIFREIAFKYYEENSTAALEDAITCAREAYRMAEAKLEEAEKEMNGNVAPLFKVNIRSSQGQAEHLLAKIYLKLAGLIPRKSKSRRADLYYQSGRMVRESSPDLAEQSYRLALKSNRRHVLALYELGLVLLRAKRLTEACACFQNATRYAPTLQPVLYDYWFRCGLLVSHEAWRQVLNDSQALFDKNDLTDEDHDTLDLMRQKLVVMQSSKRQPDDYWALWQQLQQLRKRKMPNSVNMFRRESTEVHYMQGLAQTPLVKRVCIMGGVLSGETALLYLTARPDLYLFVVAPSESENNDKSPSGMEEEEALAKEFLQFYFHERVVHVDDIKLIDTTQRYGCDLLHVHHPDHTAQVSRLSQLTTLMDASSKIVSCDRNTVVMENSQCGSARCLDPTEAWKRACEKDQVQSLECLEGADAEHSFCVGEFRRSCEGLVAE